MAFGVNIACQVFRRVSLSRAKTLVCRRLMSTAATLDIGGIYPPISTPFDVQEDIDYSCLEKNLSVWNSIAFKGYVVQGSNGESTYLTASERVEMVKQVRKMTPPGKLVIAGSGCESTRDTVEMTKRMSEVGADAALVITPCYYKNSMTNEALYKHFTKVADASPVPVILYSVPSNTGIDMSADVVIRLSTHPNIIGFKDSGGDIAKLCHMVYKTKENGFQIVAGSASFLYPALAVGCVGGICALANVLGADVCRLYKLFNDGQHQAAQELQQRLVAPNAAVTRKFGVPGLKQAMDWFGYYGGPTRSPLLPLTSAEIDLLKTAFTDSGFPVGK